MLQKIGGVVNFWKNSGYFVKPTYATLLDHLVDFAISLKFEDLSQEVVRAAKRHFLDALGCAIGGMRDPATIKIRKKLPRQSTALCNSLAFGLPTLSLDNAAHANTHLIRVLDFNDTYLSKEPAHPSDNWGALLAFIGYGSGVSGKNLLTAGVLAYEIQCRMCDAASLRSNGVDHTYYLQLSSALASGKIMGLNKKEMKGAAALALRHIPSRQVREGPQLSEAKGLAAAEAVKLGVWATLLASYGSTGPSEIIEGKHGFINLILREGALDLEAFKTLGEEYKISKCLIKKWPVEYHAQAAVEAALEAREKIGDLKKIKKIDIYSYEACESIIGGASKRNPKTKETADHSIYFILAVALLEGKISLEDYTPEKYRAPDVMKIIRMMSDIKAIPVYNFAYSNKRRPTFPVTLILGNKPKNVLYVASARTPKGHFLNPMTDKELEEKFKLLCAGVINESAVSGLIQLTQNLEKYSANKLYRELQLEQGA